MFIAGLGTSRLRTPRGNGAPGPSCVGQGQPAQQQPSGAAATSTALHSPRISTRASTKVSTPRGGSANGIAAAGAGHAAMNGQAGRASTPRTAGSQQQQHQQHVNGALSPHSAATLHEGHRALLAKLLTAAMDSVPAAVPGTAGPGPSSTAAQQQQNPVRGSSAVGAPAQGTNPPAGRATRSGAAPFGLNLGSPSTGSPRGTALLRSPRLARNSMAAAAAAGAASTPPRAGPAAAAGGGSGSGQGKRQGGTGAAGSAAEVQEVGGLQTGAQAAAALAAALPPLPLSAGGRSTRRSGGVTGGPAAAAAGTGAAGSQGSHPGPSGALQLQTGLNGVVGSPGAGGPPSWLNGGLVSLGGLGPLSSVRSDGLGGMWGRDVQVVTPNMSQHELQMLLDALVGE
jgi:hypothetical protein